MSLSIKMQVKIAYSKDKYQFKKMHELLQLLLQIHLQTNEEIYDL
jgi:hypothetical protein